VPSKKIKQGTSVMQTIQTGMYIGGEWVAPVSGSFEDVINPATEQAFAKAPVSSSDEVSQAIAAARQAFDKGPWPRMSVSERVTILRRLLDALQQRKEEIVALIVREAGATQFLASALQFDIPMKHAHRLLDDALLISGGFAPLEISPSMDGRKVLGTSSVVHDPVGVVAAITPYNFPFFLNIVKLCHALPMGNTVVLKPSPLTPLEALIIADAAHKVGLPSGVLNVITGDIQAGELLTSDPRVDMVTFTGSDKVGASIMAQGAPTLKKMHLELGGKSALIVRADANLANVVQDAMMFTTHAGQGCALTTRHLVHNSLRPAYVDMLGQALKAMKVGDTADASVHMGPLIRDAARQRCERYVDIALQAGARLVAGGRRPEHLERGYFFEPTLFDNVDNRSQAAQEEIFGPIAVVIGFDTDEEAIALANDSAFGLFGAICSADAGRAYEMALQLRTGGIAINGGSGTMLSGAPFGGYKRSGLGREYGREGLLEFCQSKAIAFRAA
jgi:aldehyde dehydrogenase (NAD+)